MKRRVSSPEALALLVEGADALAAVEAAGVRVDMGHVDRSTAELKAEEEQFVADLAEEEVGRVWRKAYGDRTNFTSREQLGDVLFRRMGYQSLGQTATGRERTDKDALDKIDDPFVRKYLRFAKVQKLSGTYFNQLRRWAVKTDKGDWYIHPTYLLNSACTYRSSAKDPLFQNIPVRDQGMAARIRAAYLPHPGHRIVEADLSQIEVRVAYCYHKDPTMGEYLHRSDSDMHLDTMFELFFLDRKWWHALEKSNPDAAKQAKKTLRHSAKNEYVFPEFYGSVYFQCARNIWDSMEQNGWTVPGTDLPLKKHLRRNGVKSLGACDPRLPVQPGTFEAHLKKIDDLFWNVRFPVYTAWKRRFYAAYKRAGGFDTFTGFRINGTYARNDVINYPVQGPAFHCLLWVLIRMVKWLRKYKMRSRVIGEIHDSIIGSVHPKEEQDYINKVMELMTKDLPKAWPWIICPIEAEVDVTGVDEPWSTKRQWVLTGGEWGAKA